MQDVCCAQIYRAPGLQTVKAAALQARLATSLTTSGGVDAWHGMGCKRTALARRHRHRRQESPTRSPWWTASIVLACRVVICPDASPRRPVCMVWARRAQAWRIMATKARTGAFGPRVKLRRRLAQPRGGETGAAPASSSDRSRPSISGPRLHRLVPRARLTANGMLRAVSRCLGFHRARQRGGAHHPQVLLLAAPDRHHRLLHLAQPVGQPAAFGVKALHLPGRLQPARDVTEQHDARIAHCARGLAGPVEKTTVSSSHAPDHA